MQPEESCRPLMDPPYYDDYYYWQWYPYWDRQQGYNADGHVPSTSTNNKDGHVTAPLCVPSDSDNSDSEMSPNAQDKDTTTGPSENLTKEENYNYRLKVINPNKKSDYIVRDLHCFHGKFDTLMEMRIKLMDEFGSLLPPTTEFQLGYFFGKQSTKFWLMCQEDLNTMNKCVEKSKGNVMLWCDARSTDQPSGYKRKKASENPPPTKRQQIEAEVDTILKDLQSKHGDKYTIPQLRCWARMISRGKYENTDTIPAFLELDNQPKKSKRTSLADAITGAAATFANAVKGPEVQQCNSQSVVISSPNSPTTATAGAGTSTCPITPGISPGRITDLRMKKLRELRELQGLLEQNVLTQEEFAEQKRLVLDSLRKLTH